jgi:YHS domain-containing protein
MKTLKSIGSMVMLGAICAGALAAFAADTNTTKTTEKLKPYTLATCVVSGEKLGEMGKPVVTNYNGQEIKFCCKDCVKDFNKEPAKYLKKIEEAEKSGKQ